MKRTFCISLGEHGFSGDYVLLTRYSGTGTINVKFYDRNDKFLFGFTASIGDCEPWVQDELRKYDAHCKKDMRQKCKREVK